jgi:cell division protein FtsZ
MDDPRKTVIKIMGLGGGGSNAVNRMIELGLEGVEFIAANSDAQALAHSLAPKKVQLGPKVTRGLGAGGKPEVGEAAAIESKAELREALEGADLVFLTAGMGGGTGTGAIPVAAEVARSLGALTVAVVTAPFTFEASRRQQNAVNGLAKLRANADTLVAVPNDKLLGLLPRQTTFEMSLRVADEVLRQGVQGLTELISKPGLINMDFANVRALMQTAGPSMMAIGQGKGEHKATDAVRQALQMPLLDLKSAHCAAGVLVHFTGGEDLSLFEVSQAAAEITTAAPNAEVLFGATVDPMLTGRAQVILVVTGIETETMGAHALDMSYHRPAANHISEAKTAASIEELDARSKERPEMAEPRAPEVHLAEALFSQAVASSAMDHPLLLTESPSREAHAGTESRSATAPATVPAGSELPAFLRRRRSLREYEEGN